jgi:hypothetical protein
VAFQLHIRQNLDAARDHFGPGEVRRFAAAPVRIGSDPASECRVDAPEFAPCHVVLQSSPRAADRVSACPQAGATTYLNSQVLTAPTVLRSGDELRVEHWTLRFQRIHEAAARNRPFNLLSGVAKLAMVLVFAAEVAVVMWLPRRMREVALWQAQVEQHQTIDLLEGLRRACRAASPTADDFERGLRREIGVELQARADYVVHYGPRLGPARTRMLHEELGEFDRILRALADKTLPPPLPVVDVDAGVRALLDAESKR